MIGVNVSGSKIAIGTGASRIEVKAGNVTRVDVAETGMQGPAGSFLVEMQDMVSASNDGIQMVGAELRLDIDSLPGA